MSRSVYKHLRWLNLSDYAPLDGIADDTAGWQEAVDICTSRKGGVIVVPAGRESSVSGTVEFNSKEVPLTVIAYGSSIKKNSNGYFFHNETGGSNPVFEKLQFKGGRWLAETTADGIWQLDDSGDASFEDIEIHDMPDDSSAWEIRNVSAWSENLTFDRVKYVGKGRVVKYVPASLTGGAGTVSFARQRWNDVFISGGHPGGYLFHLEGGVYDSQFDMISGNLDPTLRAIFRCSEGSGGTTISNVKVETLASAITPPSILEASPVNGNIVRLWEIDARTNIRAVISPLTDHQAVPHNSVGGYDVYDNDGQTVIHSINPDKVGFFGSNPIVQPTINGSAGGNAALTDLLAKLESYGLIVDLTTP